ncbi:CAP domain-containing protein [Lutispora thermophila]|uniref:Uncharacterized protein, YkwD family n=1 Tax=Lutispora thermophila DSM 19022 TaxID=1122184 RepID=A0A1M6BQY5_9FIRM|nr:CAP domain-containing protein [Lutispora thermophila]SHI51101.1 uncharacterized protein, YkwD family [Lutispora thermophila DSM 19022]
MSRSRYKRLFAFMLCILVISLSLLGCANNQYTRRISTPNQENNNLINNRQNSNRNMTNNNLNEDGLGLNNITGPNNRRSNIWGNVDYNNRISASSEKADVSYGKVKVPNIVIRSGPGSNFSKVGTVTSNQKLNVYGKAGNWYIVQVPGTKNIGCVESKYVEPYPSGTEKKQIPNVTPPVVNNNTGNTGTEAGGGTTTGTGTTTGGGKNTGAGTTAEDASGTGVMTAEEKKILELCNAERAKVGAPALKANNDLTKLARMKSKDMVDKGYFSHQSPTYGSPFDMMKNYGISYMYAGENLAQNTTAEKAFQAWMNSEGHRKNILNPNFTELGVGIASADGSKMYTQMFIGK